MEENYGNVTAATWKKEDHGMTKAMEYTHGRQERQTIMKTIKRDTLDLSLIHI